MTIVATASDNDGFIPNTAPGGVSFYADGELISTDLTAPYSATWTPSLAKSVTLIAVATDDKGNSQATTRTVTVLAVAPTVSISAPANNSNATVGTPVTINATASAGLGTTVTNVQFLVDGVAIGAADTVAPFSVSWTPSAAGTVALTARVTDSNGTAVTSAAIVVNVASAAGTIGAVLTSPTNGGTVALGSTPILTATATTAGSATVAKIDFLVGTAVVGTALSSPYSAPWTPTTTGVFVLTARVTDSNGATSTSAAVNVNVSGPSVSLTAPAPSTAVTLGLPVAVTASASAVGPATVSKVDFFAGTTAIGTAVSAPYTVNWSPSTAGAVSLTARVTDSNSGVVTSTAVSITVAAAVPTVSLTAPAAGSSVALGTTTTLAATAAAHG
ncbi:MAG: Ig-like domain-containing protein, partial [Rhodoglobus sp.]|nr:Ig-like domain-containing protein [Rhodoglobus sp.]